MAWVVVLAVIILTPILYFTNTRSYIGEFDSVGRGFIAFLANGTTEKIISVYPKIDTYHNVYLFAKCGTFGLFPATGYIAFNEIPRVLESIKEFIKEAELFRDVNSKYEKVIVELQKPSVIDWHRELKIIAKKDGDSMFFVFDVVDFKCRCDKIMYVVDEVNMKIFKDALMEAESDFSIVSSLKRK